MFEVIRKIELSFGNLMSFLFSVSVISTFIIWKIYPIFFLVFILLYFFQLIVNGKIQLKMTWLLILVTFVVFLYGLSAGLSASFDEFYSVKDNFKLFLNFTFLFVSIDFWNRREVKHFDVFLFKFSLVFIVLISTIQLAYIINVLSFWNLPFGNSLNDSRISYRLQSVPIFFGDYNKNIWATKVTFIVIAFWASCRFNRSVKFNFVLTTVIKFCSLFLIVYTLSRTAQLVFFVFIFILYFYLFWIKYNSYWVRLVFVCALCLGALGISVFAFNTFFHLDFSDPNDGVFSRFILWSTFFNQVSYSHFFIGKGAMSAGVVIHAFTDKTVENFHNVFLNVTWEGGLLALLCFILLITFVFFMPLHKSSVDYKFLIVSCFAGPLLICLNSQYLGYDCDIMIYLINSFLIMLFYKNEKFNRFYIYRSQ